MLEERMLWNRAKSEVKAGKWEDKSEIDSDHFYPIH